MKDSTKLQEEFEKLQALVNLDINALKSQQTTLSALVNVLKSEVATLSQPKKEVNNMETVLTQLRWVESEVKEKFDKLNRAVQDIKTAIGKNSNEENLKKWFMASENKVADLEQSKISLRTEIDNLSSLTTAISIRLDQGDK